MSLALDKYCQNIMMAFFALGILVKCTAPPFFTEDFVKFSTSSNQSWNTKEVKKMIKCRRSHAYSFHFIFKDIDECLDPNLFSCPGQFRVCVNTPGNYTCECQAGLFYINNTCQGERKYYFFCNSFNYVVIQTKHK